MLGGVFICYRREESAFAARAIHDRVVQRLDRENVFLDFDNIDLGVDWFDVLSERVGACDALVAVIGRNWISIADKDNRRRLDDEDDFVRIEIEAALKRGVRVIPVLVDGAAMPRASELPDSLKGLARRQGIEVSPAGFEGDVDKLTRALLSILEARRSRDAAETEAARRAEEERRAKEAAEVERAARDERERQLAAEAARAEEARRLAEAKEARVEEERKKAEAAREAEQERRAKTAAEAERAAREGHARQAAADAARTEEARVEGARQLAEAEAAHQAEEQRRAREAAEAERAAREMRERQEAPEGARAEEERRRSAADKTRQAEEFRWAQETRRPAGETPERAQAAARELAHPEFEKKEPAANDYFRNRLILAVAIVAIAASVGVAAWIVGEYSPRQRSPSVAESNPSATATPLATPPSTPAEQTTLAKAAPLAAQSSTPVERITPATVCSAPATAPALTLTIATVNNGDMIRMQQLADDFTKANPDITLNWLTLEENVLRLKVTTDIATRGGEFDVLTIGSLETPIWARRRWIVPLDKLSADYDADDLLPSIRSGLSWDGKLYAAPFYGESSFVMYRKDLFDTAGLTMPEKPTWEFIKQAADKVTDKANGICGICLRGKPGWGENMAFLTAMSNSFGARWFDEKWEPQFNTPEWKKTIDFYVALLKADGPPGASSNGFNENLALFNDGKCGMWIDATVAAGFVTDPKQSKVADKVGFALAPNDGLGKNANWLWAWALAVPAGSNKVDAAERFICWATSKHYTDLIASKGGWPSVSPGTRASLYRNPDYLKAAPFAKLTLDSINSADPLHPTAKPVPYTGVQFVAIPEFPGIATGVGQDFSAALAGTMTVDEALAKAQASTEAAMRKSGYIK
jgi:sorbitol/mannitol transport system substrate-binding protein